MIFYGYYSPKFKKLPLNNVTCPNCGTKDKMNMVASCTTVHLMFIPAFSFGKRIYQHCSCCKAAYEPLAEQKNTVERVRAEARKPWYLFIWLWLVVLFLVYVGVMALMAK